MDRIMSKIINVWDNPEKTCFRMELGSGWTWQEYIAYIDDAHATIATQDNNVNLIMWFQASIPPGNAMEALKHSGGTQPPNLRHTVMVNSSTRFLDILIKNTDRKNGWTGPKIVQTLEEARTYLDTLD